VSNTPLNLKRDSPTDPTTKLTLQIIKDAVILNADAILLELDTELHLKVHEELESLRQLLENKSLTVDQFFFKIGQLPNTFGVTYTINGVQDPTPSVSGELFGSVINILLLAVGIPYWTKDEISTPLETINPTSKWMIESKDLTQRIQLRRIRANQALPN
jgi:hypothetical protein